ncbi:MAG: PLP-dependent aminotransferase family protein [Oceanospirillaceae bacterium]|nr:PLP-dependent aminotransferase family protein [Oceanospirillaceae bacterium]
MWLPQINAVKIGAQALAQAIEKAIADQILVVGERLPPQRILAYKLGVNPTTVSRAYRRAAEKGLVGGQIGRGTYVLAQSNVALFTRCLAQQQQGVIDLSINKLECDPQLLAINKAITRANLFLDDGSYYEYIGKSLIERYQRAISQWLASARDIQFEPSQILALPSCQYAIHFIFNHQMTRGDVLIVEQYTAPGIIVAAKQHGLRLFSCQCDEQGLIPAALDAIIKQTGSRTLITVPSNQSPMGTTQSEQRRQALANIIIKHDLLVIEEDIYGMFAAPAPLAKYAPQHCLMLSGFSKCLSGGHKASFIASKHPLLKKLSKHVIETIWLVSSSAASHIITAIENGYLDDAIKLVADCNAEKSHIFGKIMDLSLNAQSPHHWIASSNDFIQQAENAGVILAHSDHFKVDNKSDQVHYRIGVNGLSADQVRQAAIILAGIKRG